MNFYNIDMYMVKQMCDYDKADINKISFSLILGTLSRPSSLEYCLDSLLNQDYDDFEIIVVDQSEDGESEKLVKSFNQQMIKYHHVEFKGLSKARNYGLKYAKGTHVCLIDDDAFYERDFLSTAVKVLKLLDRKTILSGYIFDTVKEGPFVNYSSKNNNKNLSLRSIVRTCPSAGLVIPMNLIKDVGCFDEKLGVGSIFPSGEETDIILRGIRIGYKVKYNSDLKLKHPYPIPSKTKYYHNDYMKKGLYFKGLGALFKKHLFTNKMYGLLISYFEVWIKLLIKRMLFIKYDCSQIEYQIACFREGIRQYS